MIFFGDLACPPEKAAAFNDAVKALDILDNKLIVVNLEALFLFGNESKPETLYNDKSVLDGIQSKAKKVIVSLANNHMYDYPEAIIPTKSYLEKKGIGVFGLAEPNGEILPFEYDDESGSYAFFGHCWNLYSATNPNRVNDVRIVDCDYKDFLERVKTYKAANPDRQVYCFMHWNYDLEQLPFPMHVKLSHDLIEAGVSGVIGSHSHVTHCVELYKNKPIAYCLGNFYLPSGIYFEGKLAYPESSKSTIAVRIQDGNPDVLFIDTDKNEPVKFIKAVPFTEYTPLPESDIASYTKLFRQRRVKRMLVPVFDNYSGLKYNLKNRFAIMRVNIIKSLLKLRHK